MKKIKLNIKLILIFLSIMILIVFISNKVLHSKIESFKNEKYQRVAKELQEQTKILIDEKRNATLAIGMSLSLDTTIKEALRSNNSDLIKLKEFSASLRKNSDFKNVWFQIITKKGNSFYRSWVDKKGDSLLKVRVDVVKLLEKPQIMSTISTGKFDMTFKSMVPIYDNGEFLGIFEVITHFNSIAVKLRKKGIEPVILVDKKYKKQLTKPFTKLFIGDYYVANLNANKKYMGLIEGKTIDHFLYFDKDYHEHKVNNNLITIFRLPDIYGNDMGYFILFKKITSIDMSDIELMKEKTMFYVVFIFILFTAVLYYLINKKFIEEISLKNRSMKILNDNLSKTLKEQQKLQNEKDQQQNILFQQSKMAAMGEMIGNIAHQWRQPIAIIAMWANNIIADIDMDEIENEDLRRYANNITEQTNHLSQTIDDFRNFFIPNKEKTIFTLKSSIDKTMNLLSASFKVNKIEIVEDIEDITITALENELTQAILNIIKNAKDILVTLPVDKRRLLFIDIYKKRDVAILEIKDSGGGVPKDIIDKVFEPYFTTKHKSQGTGIGLYMTESIITKHLSGEVSVQNVEYKYEGESYSGASFKIEIPLV
ncbi:MAG: ATP-binding protein [Campylobacterota bacterium]|nr:ATP-binding protein [Campylobacterota bacterium]